MRRTQGTLEEVISVDRNGKPLHLGDRVVFYKRSEWLNWGRIEGYIHSIVYPYRMLQIIADDQGPGPCMPWGRMGKAVEKIG